MSSSLRRKLSASAPVVACDRCDAFVLGGGDADPIGPAGATHLGDPSPLGPAGIHQLTRIAIARDVLGELSGALTALQR